jgi:putative flippase GtrA
MHYPAVIRFLKYSTVGLGTFLIDLALLYALTEIFAIHYLYSAGIAFLIAVSINFVLSRRYIFKGSARSAKVSYLNFILIALVGLGLVTGGMYVLVSIFSMSYVLARIFVACLTGIWNYLMNLYVNFKVAGKL